MRRVSPKAWREYLADAIGAGYVFARGDMERILNARHTRSVMSWAVELACLEMGASRG